MEFRCPRCRARLRILKAHKPGQPVPCPACKGTLWLPAEEPKPQPVFRSEPAAKAVSAPRQPPLKPGKLTLLWKHRFVLCTAIGGSLLLLLLGFAFVYRLERGRLQKKQNEEGPSAKEVLQQSPPRDLSTLLLSDWKKLPRSERILAMKQGAREWF